MSQPVPDDNRLVLCVDFMIAAHPNELGMPKHTTSKALTRIKLQMDAFYESQRVCWSNICIQPWQPLPQIVPVFVYNSEQFSSIFRLKQTQA